MTDKSDITETQERVLRALMAEMLAAELNPCELGGLGDEELAQQLEMSVEEVRREIQGLVDLGYIGRHLEPEKKPVGYQQDPGCDWRWPDGLRCNQTLHYLTLCAGPPQAGGADEAFFGGFCSLEHANAGPRPTLAAAQRLLADVARGAECDCRLCDDEFNVALARKLVDAYPDPVPVADVYGEETDEPHHRDHD